MAGWQIQVTEDLHSVTVLRGLLWEHPALKGCLLGGRIPRSVALPVLWDRVVCRYKLLVKSPSAC